MRSKKITAAHLAGIRSPSEGPSALAKWDRSTAFVAGFALAMLVVPEFSDLHSARLLALLAFVALFGIFPVLLLQHFFLQTCKRPTRFLRIASAFLALILMVLTTAAMKPIVGYDERLAEERMLRARVLGEVSRSPASKAAEAIRQGVDLYH